MKRSKNPRKDSEKIIEDLIQQKRKLVDLYPAIKRDGDPFELQQHTDEMIAIDAKLKPAIRQHAEANRAARPGRVPMEGT
jgi:hypothetical protein